MWTIKETHLKVGVESSNWRSWLYGNEHHDGANMGRNQSIEAQNLFLSLDQDHMNNDQVQKSREEKTRWIINELIMERDLS
jgi:hypothetical protein